jgi:hypothetical protein
MNIDDLRNIRIDSKNLAVVVIAALLLAGTTILYLNTFSPAAAPPSLQPAHPLQITGLPAKPTVLKGYAQEATMRDPFALPLELQQTAIPRGPAPGAGGLGSGGAGGYVASARESAPLLPTLPKLSGVVSTGNFRMAVLQYGTESRSYRVNEHIGPYELIAVSDDSVTLSGPEGKIVLTVGRR